MKFIIFLIVFINMVFSQATSLALYGTGEEIRDTDPASLALGNCSFFTGNSKNSSSGSLSSIWKSSLTRFTIHTGMNYLYTSLFPQQFQHYLTHFSLSFPIGNKKAFSFGLQPAFRTNRLEIEEDFQYNANPNGVDVAYKNHYFIDGGISKFLLKYSWKTDSNFSFGVQYSFLFGNQFINDKLYTYEIEIDTIASNETNLSEIVDNEKTYFIHPIYGEMIHVEKTHKFAGSEIVFEGRYTTSDYEWVTRLGMNGVTKVKTEDNFSADSESMSDGIISEIAFGYHYKTSDNLGVIIESQINYPFNVPKTVAIFNTNPPHENSIHLGTYYIIANPKFGFWDNLNLRSGGYLKELDFIGEKYIDYGFTFGIGLEYLANTQAFDIALQIGNKESYILQDQYEKYISLHFGITTGEKWFMKRRRK